MKKDPSHEKETSKVYVFLKKRPVEETYELSIKHLRASIMGGSSL